MDNPSSHVFFPVSYNELFASWERFPNAIIFAGGTTLIGRQEKIIDPTQDFLCLDKIDDLHYITRTEHYLEIGAMIKLNRLMKLGKIVPDVLVKSLENIAGVQVKNIATIGGNICSSSLLDLPGVLSALDAQYELRSANNTRWVSALRFHSGKILEKREILTRIRLPLSIWDYSFYKKFHESDITLTFLIKVQKNVLSDTRIIIKTDSLIRNKDGESKLNGNFLPLNRRTTEDFINHFKEFLAEIVNISDFSKNALLNSIEVNILNLTE